MPTDFKFFAEDADMVADFEHIYGRKWVYIKSPMPEPRKLENMPGLHLIVWQDLSEISPDEFYRLVMVIAGRFSAKPMAVSQRLTLDGLPLLMSTGFVVVENPKRWLDSNT